MQIVIHLFTKEYIETENYPVQNSKKDPIINIRNIASRILIEKLLTSYRAIESNQSINIILNAVEGAEKLNCVPYTRKIVYDAIAIIKYNENTIEILKEKRDDNKKGYIPIIKS